VNKLDRSSDKQSDFRTSRFSVRIAIELADVAFSVVAMCLCSVLFALGAAFWAIALFTPGMSAVWTAGTATVLLMSGGFLLRDLLHDVIEARREVRRLFRLRKAGFL
jgi:hypothetical protein